MRTFRDGAVIVLAMFLGAAACSTPDKRPPESAGEPGEGAHRGGLSALGDAEALGDAGAGRHLIEDVKRV